jgi:hypothetical protein
LQHFLLIIQRQIIENFGCQVARENAQAHRLIVWFQVRENFCKVRRGKTAQYLAKLVKVPLLDQLHKFWLEQIANHMGSEMESTGRRKYCLENEGQKAFELISSK